MKYFNKRNILLIILAITIVVLSVFACIKLVPLFESLQDEAKRIEFENFIDSLGFKGVLIILLIQILQVFIAIIPGEIVELLAGLLYGTWGGLIICLIGNAIASFLIFIVVKTFAKRYTIKFQDKLKNYSFLNNKKKVALYLFIIFLIPGLPKDVITYLVPFLPISFPLFILVTSIARIPSIISSTYSSESLLSNNYIITIVVMALFALLAIIGLLFKDKIIFLLKKDNSKDNASK